MQMKPTTEARSGWSRIYPAPVLAQFLVLILFVSVFGILPTALRWPVRLLILALFVILVWRGTVSYIKVAKRSRRVVFPFLLILFNYALFEMLCLGFDGIYLSQHPRYGRGRVQSLTREVQDSIQRLIDNQMTYMGFDGELGWTVNRNAEVGSYRSNSNGIRSRKEYSEKIPEGVIRAVCVGDSFTHGTEVGNEDTWQTQAEALGTVEFLNLGVSGYGLLQTYLRYQKDGSRFDTDYVFIGYMSANLQRTVNVYRPFLRKGTGLDCAKPYASLDRDGNLVLNPNPLSTRDHYKRLLGDPDTILAELASKDYYVQLRKDSLPVLPSRRVFGYIRYSQRAVIT
jgi:hypothetical protein